jgi:tripartite ATP-independent transporter DctP family solute receptor
MPVYTSRRSVLAAGVAVAGALALPHLARAAGLRRTIRIATVNPPASATGQACRAFADAVAKSAVLSDGLQVEVVAGGSVGGELEMTQACINGTLDLAVTASNVVGGIVPEIGLLDAPFLFRDADHARAVLDGPIGAEFAALALPKGLHTLAWAENGLRHVTANRPVRNPADLKGLHIREPQSPVMVEAFKALGANAEPLPFPELFEALRTGRFEAEENPVATVVTANFAQVQKFLSLTGHVYSAAMVIASPDLLEDLNESQRAALVGVAKAAAAASRKTASDGERDGIATLRGAGMTIVTDVDRAALAAAARPALDAIAQRLGAERARKIQEFRA